MNPMPKGKTIRQKSYKKNGYLSKATNNIMK